jgi:UTP--glucose-1-phosphate uridylyltransferase
MSQKKVKKMVIAAGGLGTRLFPLTMAQSKAMFPVGRELALERIVNWSKDAGIEEVVFVLGAIGGSVVENHFGVHAMQEQILIREGKTKLLEKVLQYKKQMRFRFVYQLDPKGDGDAVRCAVESRFVANNEPVVVWFNDTMFDSDISPVKQLVDNFYKYKHSVIALSEVEQDELCNFGVVKKYDNDDGSCEIVGFVEKPKTNPPSNLVAVGGYVLTPDMLNILHEKHAQSGEIRLADTFSVALSRSNRIFGVKIEGNWLDTGNWKNLAKANAVLSLKDDKRGVMKKFFIELGESLQKE